VGIYFKQQGSLHKMIGHFETVGQLVSGANHRPIVRHPKAISIAHQSGDGGA
jgi:hypothetical protein